MRGDDDLRWPPALQLDGEPAELRRQRDERAEHLQVGGVDHRDVHRVRDQAALERSDDLLGDDHPGPVLRLVGRGGEVRRDDDLVELEQRAGVRLGGEDVERGAGELARADRLDERVLVDQRAARGVDQARAVPHPRDRLAADQPARLVGQREVEGDEVGGGEHVLDVGSPRSIPASRKRSSPTNGS